MIWHCPQCQEPIPWRCRVWAWSPWACARCGAKLMRYVPASAMLISLLFIPAIVALTIYLWLTQGAWAYLGVFLMCTATPIVWSLVEPVRMVEAGQTHCAACGYDLKGAVRGGGFYTCPECGTKSGRPAHD